MPKARNMIIDGYKKGMQLYKDQYCLYYIFNGKNPMTKDNIENYQILAEESSKDTVSTVGRGLLGSALFGHAGISASLTGKENKIYTIRIDWDQDCSEKNREPSILELDSDFYKTFMLKCARTEEDQKEYEEIKRIMYPERYTQEVQETSQNTTSDATDIKSKLKELKSMFEEDLITEEEYNDKRQELLGKM